MARKGENIYRRKDGRYEGRYIKGYSAAGKAQFGYIYGKNYADVKERLVQCKANARNDTKTISSTIKLENWFDCWYSTQTHIKQSTQTIYLSYANKHLKPKLGNVQLKKMNKDILQKFVDDLNKDLSPKTVRAIYSMVKLCLKSAYEKNLISDFFNNIRLPKAVSKEVRVFTKQEQKKLEQRIERENKDNDIGILICLYTGIRIGELCALRWENVNLERKMITIDKTLYRVRNENGSKKTKVILSTPKSERSVRDIPIPGFLAEKLARLQKPEGFVINNNGKYIETAVYARRYKKLLELAGIEYIKPHSMRHNFAVRALEIGVDVQTLSEILGHSSVSTTLNYYGHSLPEHKRRQMERIGQLFEQSE